MARFDFRALGRLKSGELNKTERAYMNRLEAEKQSGRILWYRFEGIKLKLAREAKDNKVSIQELIDECSRALAAFNARGDKG